MIPFYYSEEGEKLFELFERRFLEGKHIIESQCKGIFEWRNVRHTRRLNMSIGTRSFEGIYDTWAAYDNGKLFAVMDVFLEKDKKIFDISGHYLTEDVDLP